MKRRVLFLKEELVAAHSLGFELQSCKLYCGYDRAIRAFDIQRPGVCVEKWDTFGRMHCRHHSDRLMALLDRENNVYQSGIISCLSFNSQISGMYAAGSYSKTGKESNGGLTVLKAMEFQWASTVI